MSSQEHAVAHAHRDDIGARMGMWLFLFTELILFGGMFILYSVYRYKYPEAFHLAAKELNTIIGTIIIFIVIAIETILNFTNICFNSNFIPIAIIAIGTNVEPKV